ncbi:hypothetical protein PHISCL_07620 [Aspergillus sclerotialis]|uniref:Uncharacterized protein n=1 Tax=Aspergillus sclerotialis TaxID=2070753 RepID=A0A3A2ZFD8_9EURO|nr:hypothetical protein PHISCL_07620 [Aspergillus sclerotialis]
MPTPIAKGSGIIITVSALVAAGIAVYESPQFQEWVNNSRRKIAVALHNLGDGIQPRDSQSPIREDISMVEEGGEAAQERLRRYREEILQRGVLFEARRRKKQTSPPDSFDSLVDENGNLRSEEPLETQDSLAKSTGVDLMTSPPLQSEKNVSTLPGTTDKDRLSIGIPSDSAMPRSETLVDLTPTSEASEVKFDTPVNDALVDTRSSGRSSPAIAQSVLKLDPLSSPSSAAGENSQPFYAHPNPSNNESHRDLGSPFADLQNSPTPSTAGSYSHIYESMDASSDGTLSDLGRSTEGIATPASWSEIGSVVSSDDGHHHAL